MRDKTSSKSLKGTTSINDLQKQINALSVRSKETTSTTTTEVVKLKDEDVGDGLKVEEEKLNLNLGDGLEVQDEMLNLNLGEGLSISSEKAVVNVGDGIEIVSNKLTIKLDADSGLILDTGGLKLNILHLAKPSIWYDMELSSGWSAVHAPGYKCEYRYVQYGSERQYFLRGSVKKSTGPTYWDRICYLYGAPEVKLPPQNQYFIVSVNDMDKNPLNFTHWTIQVSGSHNGTGPANFFLNFGPHMDADGDSEIAETDNWFSLDQISWWVDTDNYPSTRA